MMAYYLIIVLEDEVIFFAYAPRIFKYFENQKEIMTVAFLCGFKFMSGALSVVCCGDIIEFFGRVGG